MRRPGEMLLTDWGGAAAAAATAAAVVVMVTAGCVAVGLGGG